MQNKSLELTVGVFVLAGLVCLGYLTVKLGKMEVFDSQGYNISAYFDSVAGLRVGARVEMAGVGVGRVSAISLKNYVAQVRMRIDNDVKLSKDAIASVKTSGLIGDKYISVSMGGSKVMLSDNGVISETESAMDLESLISKFMFEGAQ